MTRLYDAKRYFIVYCARLLTEVVDGKACLGPLGAFGEEGGGAKAASGRSGSALYMNLLSAKSSDRPFLPEAAFAPHSLNSIETLDKVVEHIFSSAKCEQYYL